VTNLLGKGGVIVS